jgi:MFS family permease
MSQTSTSPAADRDAPLLSEHPAGAAHWRIVALTFAAWIFDFYDLLLYTFLLVPVARELHLSPAQSSFALGMSLLMTAVGGIVFGVVGDRIGRRPTIALTVAIYGIGTLLCAFSHSLAELVLYRSITGLGMGGGWAPGQSLIAESMPAESRARYAAYVQTGAPLGGLLAAAAAGFVAPRVGWRLTFALSALPALLVFIAVMLWLPESDVWMRNGRAGKPRGEVGAIILYRRVIGLLFIVVLLNSEAYWFTYTWMPGYLELKRGLGVEAASRLLIMMQLGAVVGYSTFGFLADHFGRRPMICLYGIVMAAGLIPPTLLWPEAAAIRAMIPIAMAAAGFGTGLWSGMAPIISEMLPTRIRNTALGLLLNVSRGFQFFTPLAIVFLSARFGFGATLSLGAIFSLVGAALVWILPETRGRTITDLDDLPL